MEKKEARRQNRKRMRDGAKVGNVGGAETNNRKKQFLEMPWAALRKFELLLLMLLAKEFFTLNCDKSHSKVGIKVI